MYNYVTISISGVTCNIEVDEEHETMNIDNVIDFLVKPALLGVGFSSKLVEEAIPE